jgi:hypothetical protein
MGVTASSNEDRTTADVREPLETKLAEQLDKIFILAEHWRDRTRRDISTPAPASSLAADDAATTPYQLSHAVVGALGSAVDHLDSLRVLIRQGQVLPARAPYTLLRAALENAAVAVWLLAPKSRDERVFRRLWLQWADENDRGLAYIGLDVDSDGVRDQVKDELRAIARRQGLADELVLKTTARQPSWAHIVATAGAAAPGIDGSDAIFCWSVGSGIAHAREWAVLAALQRTDGESVDGVTNVTLRASEGVVTALAATAGVMISEGWRLYDLRGVDHLSKLETLRR